MLFVWTIASIHGTILAMAKFSNTYQGGLEKI